MESIYIISYKTQCGVAVVAEHTPYLVCGVAVVNTFLGEFCITYLAVCIRHQVIILVFCKRKLSSHKFVWFVILLTHFCRALFTFGLKTYISCWICSLMECSIRKFLIAFRTNFHFRNAYFLYLFIHYTIKKGTRRFLFCLFSF
jgi:hypothetical protein